MFLSHADAPVTHLPDGAVRRVLAYDPHMMLVELTCGAETVGTEASPIPMHCHPHA